MAVTKYIEGHAYLHFSEASPNSDSCDSSENAGQWINSFEEALRNFEAINHYRGAKLSCQMLLNFKGSSEQPTNGAEEINILVTKMETYAQNLTTIERTIKQEVYILRSQGEETSIFTDVIQDSLEP